MYEKKNCSDIYKKKEEKPSVLKVDRINLINFI